MPRFSPKVKEIWDTLWYDTDIVKAEKLLEELQDPLDIAFGKVSIAYHYSWFHQPGEFLAILTEIKNENKRLKDQFIQFWINIYYCLYYLGFHNPIVSKEQAKKYFDIIEQSYQHIDYKDDWEKYICIGYYYTINALYEQKIKNDLPNAIKFQKKCINARSKIPEEGQYYSAVGHTLLAGLYLDNGDFEEAEKSRNRALDACKKYNNLWQLFNLGPLSNLNFLKGDLQKAKELNLQRLDVDKRHNHTLGISAS